MENKKELVVSVIFEGYDGERYKIPTTEHDIEKITLLDCGDIDCLCHEIQCENCIFHKGKTFRKNELHLIVEEKEEEKEEYNLEDLEEIKDFEEDTERFILFKDNEGNNQILPMLNNTIDDGKISCKNVDCVNCECINCDKCPLADRWSLDLGEFKILKPKGKRLEEK